MLTLYAETAVEVKSATHASRLEFQIPRRNGHYNKPSHAQSGDDPTGSDDDQTAFSEQHLASSSSVYFRETKHYPRTFSWRIIQQRRVLEIQAIDVSRSEKDQEEAYLTLSFGFQDPILPLGITIADPPKSDELHVFVCTNKNEIFNLRLPTNYFRALSNVPQDVNHWCRSIDVSSLAIDTVYHLYASSPSELFVAFTSGRIQALRRKAEGENWVQENYDDSSWGSTLRGIVSRRGPQPIEFGSTRLAATTVQGMIASPDAHFLYTICLNHTLRVWHLPSGRLVDTRDLLNIAREQNERIQLSPSDPGLIRLVRYPKGRHPMLVTYTPHGGGQFKFWNVKGGLTEPLVIEDRYPTANFSPPDPDPTGSTVWSLTGFEIAPEREPKPSQLWTMWRNNSYHQVYSLHFDFPMLEDAWEKNWIKASPPSGRTRGPDLMLTDPQDVTSKWLDFLFFPGRYSTAVLEAALTRYQSLTATTLSQSQRYKSLQEQMSLSIASTVSLRKYGDSEMDYERFAIDTDHQWRSYWRVVENINDGRYAPLSLCFDMFADMAWIVTSDSYVAIRECTKAELLLLNDAKDFDTLDDITAERWPYRKTVGDVGVYAKMANILSAAEKFRRSFTSELTNDLWSAIEEEIYTQADVSAADRIVLIFNQVGFSDGLAEGAEEQLLRDLQPAGGVEGVNNDTFGAILEILSHNMKRPKSNLRNTVFGSGLLSATLLDNIFLTRQILIGLLVLTIFIDESDDFDPPELFEQILSRLQAQERNLWLATHSRLVPLEFPGASTKSNKRDRKAANPNSDRRVTILEDVLTKSIRPQPAVDRPLMYLLMDQTAESQTWISGEDAVTPEDAAVHIQCDLIAHNEIGLATEFSKFQPSTPWSTYVKARLRLARAEYVEAGVYFRKAAYALACGKAIGDLKEYSAGLLSVLDAEHFNNGLPRYFQHVMALFESEKDYAQVAHFAHLALEALGPEQKDPIPNFRTEILSRLFTGELKCARFTAAYGALIQLPDLALQKSSTTSLINTILDPQSSTLDTFGALRSLERMPWTLHPHLSSHLDQHITSLAKKQTTVPLSGYMASGDAVDYLGILYALRLARDDRRGATSVLFDRLRIVQKSGRARTDPHATSIRHALLALINSLACVAPDEAYILVNVDDDPRLQGTKRRRPQQGSVSSEQGRKRTRIIITLDDLRREYQMVLDRCSRIERGDFDFDMDGGSDDASDEDHEGTTLDASTSRIVGMENGTGDAMEL